MNLENLHDEYVKVVSPGTEGLSETTNTGSAMTTAIGASASARKCSVSNEKNYFEISFQTDSYADVKSAS